MSCKSDIDNEFNEFSQIIDLSYELTFCYLAFNYKKSCKI